MLHKDSLSRKFSWFYSGENLTYSRSSIKNSSVPTTQLQQPSGNEWPILLHTEPSWFIWFFLFFCFSFWMIWSKSHGSVRLGAERGFFSWIETIFPRFHKTQHQLVPVPSAATDPWPRANSWVSTFVARFRSLSRGCWAASVLGRLCLMSAAVIAQGSPQRCAYYSSEVQLTLLQVLTENI